jgi:phage tail protein X
MTNTASDTYTTIGKHVYRGTALVSIAANSAAARRKADELNLAATIAVGDRVRDAIVARVYHRTTAGTVRAVKRANTPHARSTDVYAEVTWDDDPTGEAELVNVSDIEALA